MNNMLLLAADIKLNKWLNTFDPFFSDALDTIQIPSVTFFRKILLIQQNSLLSLAV